MPRKRAGEGSSRTKKTSSKKIAKRTKRAADRPKVTKKVTKKKVTKTTKKAPSESMREQVLRISETDALKFGKMDAELRNHALAVQVTEFEIAKLEQAVHEQVKGLKKQRAQYKQELMLLQPQYNALVQGIADDLGIANPARMVIDPDTGIVQDLTKE